MEALLLCYPPMHRPFNRTNNATLRLSVLPLGGCRYISREFERATMDGLRNAGTARCMRFAEPIKVLGSQSSMWTSRYSRTVLTRQTSGNKKLSPPLAAPEFVSFSACLLILVPSQLVRPVYSSAISSPLELLTSNAFALPRSIAPL